MKVKILKSCSGYSFSFRQGETADVEKYIAEDLVNCGFAENAETKSTAAKRDTKTKGDTKADGDTDADA